MVQRDPDPVDDVDPEPEEEIDPPSDPSSPSSVAHASDPEEYRRKGNPLIRDLLDQCPTDDDPTDDDDDELGDLTVQTVDPPEALDAWLQVSRLMSLLESGFQHLSDIEGGLREKIPDRKRIRRGARGIIRIFDDVALSIPDIATQVAVSMTSGDRHDYGRFISQWYNRIVSRRKAHDRRFRRR